MVCKRSLRCKWYVSANMCICVLVSVFFFVCMRVTWECEFLQCAVYYRTEKDIFTKKDVNSLCQTNVEL